MQDTFSLPKVFVWTKFGIESGESASSILLRKERERVVNGGVFLWGIGNNIGPSIQILSRTRTSSPEVLFSPIISAPRACDASPAEVVVWTEAETITGEPFDIPSGSMVTSRGGTRKKYHFALVCYSSTELCFSDTNGIICSAALRNLASGRQVGSSQVTSVVENHMNHECGRTYRVAMRLELQAPYFIRLKNPVPHGEYTLSKGISASRRTRVHQMAFA